MAILLLILPAVYNFLFGVLILIYSEIFRAVCIVKYSWIAYVKMRRSKIAQAEMKDIISRMAKGSLANDFLRVLRNHR